MPHPNVGPTTGRSNRSTTPARPRSRALIFVGACAVLVIAALSAPPAFAQAPATPPFTDRLWRLLGALHPVVVHFPIALLIIGAVAVALRRTVWPSLNHQIVTFTVTLGALGAVAAAVMGWARATGRTQATWDTLFIHRWLGVSVAVLAVVFWVWTLASARRASESNHAWRYTFAALALCGLVGFTGHLGGELVYPGMIQGALSELISPSTPIDYSTALAESAPAASHSDPADPADPAADPPAPALIDFTTQVWPILQNRCVKCHGPEKHKGKLRLDSEQTALSHDPPAYIAGNAADSEMLLRITDPDEEFHMPPPGEADPVTVDEFRILKRWIEQGAHWPAAAPSDSAPTPAARPTAPASDG